MQLMPATSLALMIYIATVTPKIEVNDVAIVLEWGTELYTRTPASAIVSVDNVYTLSE